VIVEAGVEKLLIDAVSTPVAKFDLPLSSEGLFNVIIDGSYGSDFGPAQMALISVSGSGSETVVRSWSSDGNLIAIAGWVYAAAPTNGRLLFRITTNAASDVMKFTELVIECSPRQQ